MKVFEDIEEAFCQSHIRPPDRYTAEEVEEAFSAVNTYADLSPEQADAHRRVLEWFNHFRLTKEHQVLRLGGHAGVGKTTLTGVIANTLNSYSVAYCALTGRAASILRKTLRRAGVSWQHVSTIHSLMYRAVQDAKTGALRSWKKVDPEELRERFELIVVDEASMIDEATATDLEATGLPILAVGDHGQLAPIKGRSFWMEYPDIRLEKIHRQAEGSPIIQLATHVRTTHTLDGFQFDGQVVDCIKPHELNDKLMAAYEQHTPREVAILVYTNGLRRTLNENAHYLWTGQEPGSVPHEQSWVICLRNNHSAGLMNGMRGYLEESARDSMRHWYRGKMYFPNEQLAVHADFLKYQLGRDRAFEDLEKVKAACRSEDLPKWKQIGLLLDYGYAITVHKAQGSQFKHVFLVYERPQYVEKEDFTRWLYTGVTRSSERVTIVWNG